MTYYDKKSLFESLNVVPRLMKVLLFVVAMCHWSACLFWVIGRPESLMTDLRPAETGA